MDNDTRTLELLKRSLAPPAPDLRPTAGELHAFERAVRLAFAAPSEAAGRGRPYRTLVAVVGAFALAAASSVLALRSGAELPRPVRAVVFAAGVPVESPALADARRALGSLEAALAGDDLERIADAAAEVRERFTDLGDGERSKIEERATAALQEADRLLAPRADEPGPPTTTSIDPPPAVPGTGSGSGAAPEGGEQSSDSAPDDGVSGDEPDEPDTSEPDTSEPDEPDEPDEVEGSSSSISEETLDSDAETGSDSAESDSGDD